MGSSGVFRCVVWEREVIGQAHTQSESVQGEVACRLEMCGESLVTIHRPEQQELAAQCMRKIDPNKERAHSKREKQTLSCFASKVALDAVITDKAIQLDLVAAQLLNI